MDRPASRPAAVVAALDPVGPDVPISAVLAYAPAGDGTDIQMRCVYRTSPYSSPSLLSLVIYAHGTSTGTTLRTWYAQPGDNIKVTAHASVGPAQIVRIEVQRAGTPLLVHRPT